MNAPEVSRIQGALSRYSFLETRISKLEGINRSRDVSHKIFELSRDRVIYDYAQDRLAREIYFFKDCLIATDILNHELARGDRIFEPEIKIESSDPSEAPYKFIHATKEGPKEVYLSHYNREALPFFKFTVAMIRTKRKGSHQL